MKRIANALIAIVLGAGLLFIPTAASAHPPHEGPTRCNTTPRTESANVNWNHQFRIRRVEWWKFCWAKGNSQGTNGHWVQSKTIRITLTGVECGSPGDLTSLEWRTRAWSPATGFHWRTGWHAMNCEQGTSYMTRSISSKPHIHFIRRKIAGDPKWSTNYRIHRRGDPTANRVTVRGEYDHPNDDTPSQSRTMLVDSKGKVIR